ncbi:MAG: SpoIIE family protein phosphatase, partial [Planctomycetaceae bacterium]|nr:SpoIIE family protein phosphatase [Planctomycetaceae bacterium]
LRLDRERTVFGRHPSSQVVLDNEAVSRHHAQILQSHGHFFLEDLKSRNGTLVNGRPVDQPTELHENDSITLCDFVFHFHDQQPEDGPKPAGNELLEHDTDNSRYFAVGVEPVDDDAGSSSIVSKVSVVSIARDHSVSDPEAKLHAVLEISKSLGQVLELDEVLTRVLDGLFEIFPQVQEGFVLLRDDDNNRPVIKATRNRGEVQDRPPAISLTIIREAMQSGEAILSADVLGDNRFESSQSIAGLQLRSMMCAPLMSQEGQALGVIQLASRDVALPFIESDLDVLIGVATQGALAIENAALHSEVLKRRDLERELEFATQVQLGFLPNRRPRAEGLEFCDYYEAAQQVGGDYFDYVELPDGRVAVAVADVAGKGIPAALLMARLYSATRYHLLTEGDLGRALSDLNRDISTSGLGHRFITCVLAIIDPVANEATLANAGHLPPLVRHPDGSVTELVSQHHGMPLGIVPDQEFQQEVFPLAAGDTWLLFTDGVTEAMNGESEIFGTERLKSSLAAAPQELDALILSIVSDVETYCDGRSQSDDMCLVAFRHIGSPS